MTDWRSIRMHYEVLGENIKDLSERYHVSPALINAAVAKEGWVRHPIANTVRTWPRSEDTSEEVMSDVRTKAGILDTLRATELGPTFLTTETLLLNKISNIIEAIDVEAEDAAKQLKLLVESLRELKPIAKPVEETPGGSGLQVNILNHFGDSVPAVVCDVTPVIELKREQAI